MTPRNVTYKYHLVMTLSKAEETSLLLFFSLQ